MFQAAGADFASPLLESQCTTVAFESVNAVKTVDRSNRPKCFFSGLCSFFPDSAAVCRDAGASPGVAQRSNCQGVPWSRCGSMRWHCLEIETQAMHCAQSRACSSSTSTRVDRRAFICAHDSSHCKKILAPVTRYGRETRY